MTDNHKPPWANFPRPGGLADAYAEWCERWRDKDPTEGDILDWIYEGVDGWEHTLRRYLVSGLPIPEYLLRAWVDELTGPGTLHHFRAELERRAQEEAARRELERKADEGTLRERIEASIELGRDLVPLEPGEVAPHARWVEWMTDGPQSVVLEPESGLSPWARRPTARAEIRALVGGGFAVDLSTVERDE